MFTGCFNKKRNKDLWQFASIKLVHKKESLKLDLWSWILRRLSLANKGLVCASKLKKVSKRIAFLCIVFVSTKCLILHRTPIPLDIFFLNLLDLFFPVEMTVYNTFLIINWLTIYYLFLVRMKYYKYYILATLREFVGTKLQANFTEFSNNIWLKML